MVNDRTSEEIRQKIIQRLFDSTAPLSGQVLSGELGISRVAVWKHIQALQQKGCLISSCSKGYSLDRLPDGLSSWNFPRLDFPLLVRDRCSSTMDTAREALGSFDLPFAVAADSQDKGVSGSGAEWLSDTGGIYTTSVILPVLDFPDTGLYNCTSALAVCRILEKRGIPVAFRWPRSIYLEGQKIGGVITEVTGPFDAPLAVSLGVGLYVHNQSDTTCSSLAALLNEPLSRRDLLEDILLEIHDLTDSDLKKIVGSALYSFCMQAGCSAVLKRHKKEEAGKVCGISPGGALVFSPDKSKTERLIGSWEAASLDINSGETYE